MIEINNLVKKYGDHTAVDHLSLVVEPGKIYGFLGPNGAGKSTTMNMITGYLGATSGEIKINGHDILKEPGESKEMYRLSAGTSTTVHGYDGKGVPVFCGRFKTAGKKALRSTVCVEEAMETDRVRQRAGRTAIIRNLSKGIPARVGFAQAILGVSGDYHTR